MFKLRLVTPAKKLVDNLEAVEVVVPGFRGELDLLPGHAPLVTTLETGIIKYQLVDEVKPHYVAVSWGYCEVNPEGVIILAETAEVSSDVDISRARETLKMTQSKLESDDISVEDSEKLRRKLRRAEVRIQVAELST